MTPWTTACQAFLSHTISRSLPTFMSIALVMPSSRLILWLLLLLLPSIFPSIRGISESAVCIRWPKYWRFVSASVLPMSSSVFHLLYSPALTTVCDHWEDHSFNYTDFCWQSNASAFQHTKFVIAFLPRSNRLQISWLQSLSTVILEPKRRKSVTTSTCPPSFAMK